MANISSINLQRPDIAPSGMGTLQAQQGISQLSSSQAAKLGPSAAVQMGAGVEAQRGQEIAQNLQQAQQTQQKRGQIGINKFATQQRAEASKRLDVARRTALDTRQRISAMGRDLDQKLFQDRLKFDYDQRGIRFSNERQLADFKRMVAKDDEEYQNFAQDMQQRSTEKRKLLQVAHAKITQALTQLSAAKESTANFEQKKRLAQAAADLDAKIKKEANAAKNRALIFQGVGTVAGAVIGTLASNPVLGAAVGSTVGTIAAQQTEGVI